MNRPPNECRRRRRHTAEFKREVVATCQHPGVSMAAVAMAQQLNANLLRRWVQEARMQRVGDGHGEATMRSSASNRTVPTFVPVTLQAEEPEPQSPEEIRIEIHRQQGTVQITWPATRAEACAQWLRDLLR